MNKANMIPLPDDKNLTARPGYDYAEREITERKQKERAAQVKPQTTEEQFLNRVARLLGIQG